MNEPMSPSDLDSDPTLAAWHVADGKLRGEFRATSYAAGLALVAAIGAAAEAADHHPDLDYRYPGVVGVTLFTHSQRAITSADVDFARHINDLADAQGAVATG